MSFKLCHPWFVGVFRECGGTRCIHNMVPYRACRQQALNIVQQLVLSSGGDEDLATLLGLMHTSPSTALELNTHILKVYIFFYLHTQTQYAHTQGLYLLLLTRSNSIHTYSRFISSSTYTLKLNTHILKVYIVFYLHARTQYTHHQGFYEFVLFLLF